MLHCCTLLECSSLLKTRKQDAAGPFRHVPKEAAYTPSLEWQQSAVNRQSVKKEVSSVSAGCRHSSYLPCGPTNGESTLAFCKETTFKY